MASTLTRFRRPATAVVSTLLAGGLAAGLVSRLAIKDLRADSPVAAPPPPPKTFGSGPAFLSLPLESAEQVNHNTKRLRFRLPSEQAVSGLPLTCEFCLRPRRGVGGWWRLVFWLKLWQRRS